MALSDEQVTQLLRSLEDQGILKTKDETVAATHAALQHQGLHADAVATTATIWHGRHYAFIIDS